MTTMWKRAMLYLGLGPDEEYEDHDEERDERAGSRSGGAASPEPSEAHAGSVRAMPRERVLQADQPPAAAVAARRSGVVRPIAPVPEPVPSVAKPFAVEPVSFNDAQEVADTFMAGTPVIMNLEGLDRDLARRLVDFASGLCYGMRGQMEKVTTSVYLLTPSNVEVSAEDKRQLRSGGG